MNRGFHPELSLLNHICDSRPFIGFGSSLFLRIDSHPVKEQIQSSPISHAHNTIVAGR